MDTRSDTKILIKLKTILPDGSKGYRWVHFCYVNTEIYQQFMTTAVPEIMPSDFNELLSNWCMEDFSVALKMDTDEDVWKLKDLIKEHYKTVYPELYRDSTTDKQGWTRIWVTSKMERRVNNGK